MLQDCVCCKLGQGWTVDQQMCYMLFWFSGVHDVIVSLGLFWFATVALISALPRFPFAQSPPDIYQFVFVFLLVIQFDWCGKDSNPSPFLLVNLDLHNPYPPADSYPVLQICPPPPLKFTERSIFQLKILFYK